MKLVSFREEIGEVIRVEMEKVCSEDDTVWWDAAPDSILCEAEGGDGTYVQRDTFSVSVVVVAADDRPRATCTAPCTLALASTPGYLETFVQAIAERIAFERMAHAMGELVEDIEGDEE